MVHVLDRIADQDCVGGSSGSIGFVSGTDPNQRARPSLCKSS